MATERQDLLAAIVALDSQRALIGDGVVDAALAPLRAQLALLEGGRIEVAAGSAQALKQVTILFLDVVGSTALSGSLEPEEIHAVIDGALQRFTKVVGAREGRVLQYAGDSLLAVFGADESREDDAERAIRAGLELLSEARLHAVDVQARHAQIGFDVRIGIHTGGVLLGGGVDAAGTIRGSAVNIAARMEQTAPTGSLRISHDTYRHVRGVFDVEAQAPIEVKGLREPVLTYLVQRAKPRAFRVVSRGIEGVETRMVGRDAELGQLQQAFRRVGTERRLVSVTVVADAGIGKSRLLYEFENWAEARAESFYLFRGRATPQTQSQPYGLLHDILAWRFEIAEGDSLETARRKFEQAVVPLFGDEHEPGVALSHAHVLGHLIGVDFGHSEHIAGIAKDGRQIRSRGFHAAAQVFRRIGARDGVPVVLLLDDLHWADDGSLEFVQYLADHDRDVPMLILGVARPTLLERRADWFASASAMRVELEPLGKTSSRELADEMLKKLADIPAALRELIIGRAEGNPFYMEELVKMLIDQGAIEALEDRWIVKADRLLATQLPQTLTGVLQARLDSLEPAEKLALQQASIFGLVFWDESLGEMDAAAPRSLPALCERGLVRSQPDARLGTAREYIFQHQILHQVTYDTLLKRDRSALHLRAADWLARQTDARVVDFLGPTAEHYEKGGDTESACEFYARAAESAAARYAHDSAWTFASRALELLDAGTGLAGGQGPEVQRHKLRMRWRVLTVREELLSLQGRRAEQRDELDALRDLADSLDDDRLRAMLARWRCGMAMRTSDFAATARHAREAIDLAGRVGDEELRLNGQRLLALALVRLDSLAAAQPLALDGLRHARAHGYRRVEGLFLGVLAIIAGLQEGPLAGLKVDEEGLAIWRELGDRVLEAITLINLGGGWCDIGEPAQARQHLMEGLKLCRAVGDRPMQCSPLIKLSTLALWEGDAALALQYARAALEIAVEVQGVEFEAIACCNVGEAELTLGHLDAAEQAFDRAATVARSLGGATLHDAAAGQARLALKRSELAEAMRLVLELLDCRGASENWQGTERAGLIGLTCYRVLARAGDARAVPLLSELHHGLSTQAAELRDPGLTGAFLRNIPEHRAIEEAWDALETGGSASPASKDPASTRVVALPERRQGD